MLVGEFFQVRYKTRKKGESEMNSYEKKATKRINIDHIKCIVCDLDGTLLDDHKILDAHIIEVLEYLDIPLTFASGRNVEIAQKYRKQLGIVIPYICNNGANIYKGNVCIHQTPLVQSELEIAMEILNNHYIPYLAYTEDVIYQFGKNASLDLFTKRLQGTTIIEHNTEPVGNVFKVVITPYDLSEMEDVATLLNETCLNTECIRIEGTNYCLTNKHSTKGNAIKWLMKTCGFSKDEILVFGDNYNDVAMFKEVTYSCAMENAREEVKKQATYVCKSNNDCGVSSFLKMLIQESKQ